MAEVRGQHLVWLRGLVGEQDLWVLRERVEERGQRVLQLLVRGQERRVLLAKEQEFEQVWLVEVQEQRQAFRQVGEQLAFQRVEEQAFLKVGVLGPIVSEEQLVEVLCKLEKGLQALAQAVSRSRTLAQHKREPKD